MGHGLSVSQEKQSYCMAGAHSIMAVFIGFVKKCFGLRTVKTFLAVLLSSLIMRYIFYQPPFFACIGAVIGIAIASFTENMFLLSLGIIPLIWVNRALRKTESIAPGAIVYFAVAYLNTIDAAWVYGVTRTAGTFLGT